MLAMLGVMSNWLSPFAPGSATWLMMRPLPRRGSAFKVALALDGIPDFAAAPKGLERACAESMATPI